MISGGWLLATCSRLLLLFLNARMWVECCAGSNAVLRSLQYPFLGPPSTRLAAALSSGSCQCQAAALQLSVDLQELEAVGLGEKRQGVSPGWRRLLVAFLTFTFQRLRVYFNLTFSFPFSLSDESTELQTQICNSFKSLVVQLQGEELGHRPRVKLLPPPPRQFLFIPLRSPLFTHRHPQ